MQVQMVDISSYHRIESHATAYIYFFICIIH